MGWREDFDYVKYRKAMEFLIEHELDDVAAGITRQVISRDVNGLSEKQAGIFEAAVLERWLRSRCECGNHEVEPDDLIGLWANEGYCPRCAKRMEKDLRRENT